jgi:hypothetical protein
VFIAGRNQKLSVYDFSQEESKHSYVGICNKHRLVHL